ncbi:MAG: alpha/beta hydrolase [Rhodospirillaceae bacterium]|nr:MAG: alpha/beta hydrolase [Rhodospirillaceae bacterium]
MATYVLVHGGSHGGWCWQSLSRLLRAAGHDVYTPTLTGLGERAHLLRPDINLDTHIADVVGVLHFEGITNAILVGHSYGGTVITGVADRALSRVGHLVFLDASHPHDGDSMVSMTPEIMNAARSDLRVIDGVELVRWPGPEHGRSYGVTDPHDVAWMQDKLTPQPWKTFEQPLRLANEAALRKIPFTNINCTPTLKVRPPESLQRALAGDRVWEIDTGHDLMITEPEKVAELLLRVAAL